jgi:hypothetical protein
MLSDNIISSETCYTDNMMLSTYNMLSAYGMFSDNCYQLIACYHMIKCYQLITEVIIFFSVNFTHYWLKCDSNFSEVPDVCSVLDSHSLNDSLQSPPYPWVHSWDSPNSSALDCGNFDAPAYPAEEHYFIQIHLVWNNTKTIANTERKDVQYYMQQGLGKFCCSGSNIFSKAFKIKILNISMRLRVQKGI